MDVLPPSLKGIQPYIILAKQHSKRDPIVSYYSKFQLIEYKIFILKFLVVPLGTMYAVQQGIKVAKGDQGAKSYLGHLMDQLGQV